MLRRSPPRLQRLGFMSPSGRERRMGMHKLTVLVLVTLLVASSSVSMAKQRKTAHKPGTTLP